jgi:hypothetical protein
MRFKPQLFVALSSAAAGLVLLASSAAAQAVPAPTVTVGSTGQLVAHLMVVVPVTITCAPRSPLTYAGAQAHLQEAVDRNKQVASVFEWFGDSGYGNGFGTEVPPTGAITCDNTAHTYAVGFVPQAPPTFDRGTALVDASVTVCTGTPQNYGSYTENILGDCTTGTTGSLPHQIQIVLAPKSVTVQNTHTANAVTISPSVAAAATRAAATAP